MEITQLEKDAMVAAGNNPELQKTTETEQPPLTKEELIERSFDLRRLWQISQVREGSHPQFDGMGYMKYNETNEMADISYLAPKKNKGDSRITTGVTHEKDSSTLAFLLNFNFEGSVRVFHKDKEMEELGTAITKLVRKSRELENYDLKRKIFYRNIITQGTAFSCEEYEEVWVPNKEIIGDIDLTKLDTLKWKDNGYKKIRSGCITNLVDGKKVFLEDIRQSDINKQPGVYTVEYAPREIIQKIWGKTERWKYVPHMITPASQQIGTLTQGSVYSDWIFGEIDFNKCEIIKVYRPYEQRYQVYINGVPMLPAKFPLTAVSPSGLINIAKGDIDPMNMFAYSKSDPAKMKIDQAVFDEILQNMIIKFRQSAFVPRVNNTDKILTPEMFLGGKVIANIDPKMVEPLIQNPGITNSDFSFYQLFKTQLDTKSVSSMFEGQQQDGGGISLGQYMDMQKKQMLKLGGKIDGVIQWERSMLKLRVMNLLAHGYEQDEKGNYKDVAMHDKLSDGSTGLNIMKFINPNTKTSEEVFNEQNDYKKSVGQPAEITYLNPELMKEIITNPEYYICYEVVPVDKNNDKLAQMMFVQNITQAAQLFGMDSLQVQGLKKQYAAIMGKSFDEMFISEQEMEMKRQQAQLAAQAAGQNPNAKPEEKTAVDLPDVSKMMG